MCNSNFAFVVFEEMFYICVNPIIKSKYYERNPTTRIKMSV